MAGWIIDQPLGWATDSFAQIGNKIYTLYGGDEYSLIVSIYDLSEKTLTDVFIRLDFTAISPRMVAFGTNLYILAASASDRNLGITHIYKYDTINNITTKITSSYGLPPTGNAGIIQVDGKIYIMGGSRAVDGTLQVLSNVRMYNILENSWSNLPNMPVPAAYFTPVYLNNKIYFICGMTYDSSGINPNAYAYNLSTGVWDSISAPIVPRKDYAAISIDNSIYIIGGSADQGLTRSIEVYSPETNSWTLMDSLPDSITVYSDDVAFLYNYYIFIFGALAPNGSIVYFNTRTSRIANPFPASGFVNERIENRFSWQLSTTPPNVPQSSAVVEWRLRDSSTVNTIKVGSNQFTIIPANTLPQGEFEWRVSATTVSGVETPFTDWLLLTTIDAIPDKPMGLFPNSGTRDGTREIQFSWVYRNPLSSPQFAFEIQTTYDNGQTWNSLTGKIESENAQYLAAPNSIIPTNATGQIGWRVRTYNTDNISGLWSDVAFFIVHAAPQPLVWISVESGKSRPLCRWVSIGQIGLQVQVMSGSTIVFDSGEIFGTSTEYRISDFIPNGIYNFRGRIKNIRGLWSEWADFAVSINARQALTINLTGQSIKNGAQLNFDADVR